MSKIKKEVLSIFKDYQTVFLATAKDDQPRVRPVTLINFEKSFWVMTVTKDQKVRQIQKNPRIEFCLFLSKANRNGYIRLAGKVKIVKDKKTKTKLAKHYDFFNKYWKNADDPNYTLLEIHPKEIEYLRQGEFRVHKFKL
ncbi:MAG: pyridoxamine 5'-phosphate oxidase family protein [bacterium]